MMQRAHILTWGLLVSLLLAWGSASANTNDKFIKNNFTKVDPRIIQQPWRPVPFQQMTYTMTADEVRDLWPELMRGMRFPYPSAEYLKERYTRYPKLRAELKFKDADWEMHEQNTLEVWILFFRGDFQEAYRLGHEYGGMSRIPAIMAEIIYATYMTDLQHNKNILLQDAANWISHYAQLFDHQGDDVAFRNDYLMIRLGYSYAMARIADDAPVPAVLASGIGFKVIEAVDEMLEVEPGHPLALALQASIDAGTIRRLGKTFGKMTLRADSKKTKQLYDDLLARIDNLAILYYEHANSLLYIDKNNRMDEALDNLQKATQVTPMSAMEELDRLYAEKRFKEIYDLIESRKSFRKFDKAREKYKKKTGSNMYSIWLPPFSL